MAKELAGEYPIFQSGPESDITVTPDGLKQHETGLLYRFESVKQDWVLILGRTALSLETTSYVSHEDFARRFAVALEALRRIWPVPHWVRVGYRYTNRLAGKELSDIQDLFNPAVLGGMLIDRNDALIHSISESLYGQGDAYLVVRSARLPPNSTIDPSLVPATEASWVLDLDAYDENRSANFEVDQILAKLRELAGIGYSHFTRVITTSFIERYK
jgi:uncharacterized protein (TIGR04255 family)